MDTCTLCELILISFFGICLWVRWATSFFIFLTLFTDYKSEALLLAIFALLCFLTLSISLILACLARKYQSNSSDDYRFELLSENERRKNYIKKCLIFLQIISYLFSIGIIEEYSRINTDYMSENTIDLFNYHIFAFFVDIVVGCILLCKYCSKN